MRLMAPPTSADERGARTGALERGSLERQLGDTLAEKSVPLQRPFMVGALVLDVLTVLSCWQSPVRMAATLAVCTTALVLPAVAFPRLAPKLGEAKLRRSRLASNFVFHVLKVVLTHASGPTWAWLAILGFMANGSGTFFTRRLLLALIPIQFAVGLYYGSDWLLFITFLAFTVTVHFQSELEWRLLLATAKELVQQRDAVERANDQLRMMHARAIQQEKLSSLGQMAAGIAHEVNNPLASLKSNLSQLQLDLPRLATAPSLLEEYQQEILPDALEAVQRMSMIVADLLRFARGDEESPVEFDVNEEIRLAVRMTQGHLRSSELLRLDLPRLPRLTGYPRQTSQVLVNLLLNATYAVKAGGQVTVTSGADGELIWFKIADTGIGMSADVRDRIFDPFFTTKPAGEGTGLGLAVAHGIVSGLSGRIEVESAPGQGTTLTVWLPRECSAPGSLPP
jgi:two-component system, NtrC family, sensor kinase